MVLQQSVKRSHGMPVGQLSIVFIEIRETNTRDVKRQDYQGKMSRLHRAIESRCQELHLRLCASSIQVREESKLQ